MMEKRVFALGLLVLSGSAFAVPQIPTNIVNEPTFASLEASLGVALQPIDLSSHFIDTAAGLNGDKNVLDSAFAAGPFYNGILTSEVLANGAVPGAGVTDVVIRYTFFNDGSSVQAIDTFNFGAGSIIDFSTILNATQGRIDAGSSYAGSPLVTVDNGGNNTYDFEFAGGSGSIAPGETFVWYVAADGASTINLVDVNITDFGNANAKALVFSNPEVGQDDLNVPTPGAMLLAGLGFGAAGLRRRR